MPRDVCPTKQLPKNNVLFYQKLIETDHISHLIHKSHNRMVSLLCVLTVLLERGNTRKYHATYVTMESFFPRCVKSCF